MYTYGIHCLAKGVSSVEASIVDLRYRMKDVLKALGRRERVKILCHGKVRGTIMPALSPSKRQVADHEFFSMIGNKATSVQDTMDELRGGRHNAL